MDKTLLEKKQLNTEELIVYAPDTLNYITKDMVNSSLQKLPNIFNFFEIDLYRTFQVNIFDNLEKFRRFVLSMREDKNSLPEYARGTFDMGMINLFIENNIIKNSPLYKNKLYYISHEIFHILYRETILKNNQNKRVVWLDEGMAQYFSGEKEHLNREDEFQEYFNKVVNNTITLPILNNITHRNGFKTNEYNGYDLSYLCVKYLFETRDINEIRKIIYSYEESLKIGNNLLEEMLGFYKIKLNLETNKKI